MLTFGGAYSNHIRATAAARQAFGLATIGMIRGDKEHRPLNPSLREAAAAGMRLAYLDRATYRRKTDPDVIAALQDQFGDFYLLPEGGSNGLAARGCARIPAEIGVPFDVICCPCGTGGTLAGIAAGLRDGQQAIGFSALRGGGRFLPAAVGALQREAFSSPPASPHSGHNGHNGHGRRLEDRRPFPLRRLRPAHRGTRSLHRRIHGPPRPHPGMGLRRQDDVRHLRPCRGRLVRPRHYRRCGHHRMYRGISWERQPRR